MGLPADVIVADRFNHQGQKVVVGFSCSHDFDPETNPGGESGPLYYAQVAKGGHGFLEIWSESIDVVQQYMQSGFGFTIPADSVAAMEQTRADANCG